MFQAAEIGQGRCTSKATYFCHTLSRVRTRKSGSSFESFKAARYTLYLLTEGEGLKKKGVYPAPNLKRLFPPFVQLDDLKQRAFLSTYDHS